MASMPFSASLHACLQPKMIPTSPRWTSIALSIPSIKTSFQSSKSAISQHGFSLQSSTFPGFLLNSRSFSVNARAATEKTIYDFNVKVSVLRNNKELIFFVCSLSLFSFFVVLNYGYCLNLDSSLMFLSSGLWVLGVEWITSIWEYLCHVIEWVCIYRSFKHLIRCDKRKISKCLN